ncbi:MAG: indole-3-glycerol phosphate synthase TrpC, partial [Deltaproteobacteria bacterium]
GVRVIAEVKRRSPSAGDIQAAADPVAQARAYTAGGAAAISVLTEPAHFGGALSDLEAVAAAVSAPCLRKDFIVSQRQLLEARVAGASLVLLIVAILDDAELRALREAAEALGMHALVEAHDAEEVDRAVASGARIIGVNNRDLRTFSIDLATCERLRSRIPPGVVAIAESGVNGPADVSRLRASGYDVFLVGTALMRAADPAAALAALLGAEAAA